MIKERKLTCIVCPKGCDLTVRFNSDGAIEDISGYTCKRGEEYAHALRYAVRMARWCR